MSKTNKMKVELVPVANGIPTSREFKRLIGRTGLGATFKWKDPGIERICRALDIAERVRSLTSLTAVPQLRAVRKECNFFLSDHNLKPGREKNRVEELRDALSARIQTIATFFHGPRRARDEAAMAAQQQFEALYDNCFTNPVTGAGRALDKGYHVERNNPWNINSSVVLRWKRSNTQLGLQDWYENVHKWELEDGMSSSITDAEIEKINTKSYGVRYLGPIERQDFKVSIRNGVAKDAADFLVHTGGMTSTSSGKGWGIYVLDHYNNLYVGAHETDRFHHSSFMAGGPVQAAGEIAISGGKVVGITNKTGHYKAGPLELKTAIEVLRRNGVNIDQLAVGDPFNARDVWVSGTDALEADGKLAEVPADRHIPKPQPVPE